MSKTYYSYSDIFLLPKYSKYHSRSEADTSVKFGKKIFKLPVMPANMKCTIDQKLASWMSENDYFYVMHRFNANTNDAANTDNKKFIEIANKDGWKNISISLGVKDEDMQLIEHCIKNNLRIDYITIDIAHAHSVRMQEMLAYLNRMYRSDICKVERPFIIAGNVASPVAVVDLENWGADATKVGIAAGKACRTFNETGFGVPMFTVVMECAAVAKKPIIADGGISECGDIAKAIRAGGTMVMAGGMFACSSDSPAETIYKNFITGEVKDDFITPIIKRKEYKRYFGSASQFNTNSDKHVEGTLVELECDGVTYKNKLRYIAGHLQSSISYAGGDLKNVVWGVKNNKKL
jgi:GMP reductase